MDITKKKYPFVKWVKKGGKISPIEELVLDRFLSKRFSSYDEFARLLFNERIDSWNEDANLVFQNTRFGIESLFDYYDYIRREYDDTVRKCKELQDLVCFGKLRVKKINKAHGYALIWEIGKYCCIQCTREYEDWYKFIYRKIDD